MKNLKLIIIVILLIIANLYILISISFEMKYRVLIDDYTKLKAEYNQLYDEYIAQEEKLQTVMAAYEENTNITNSLNKVFSIENKGFKYFFDKIKIIKWKNFIDIINVPITKS